MFTRDRPNRALGRSGLRQSPRPCARAVIVIPRATKRKGCRNPSCGCSHRVQHFGQALHLAGLRLESDLDKVAPAERASQLQ